MKRACNCFTSKGVVIMACELHTTVEKKISTV